MDLIVYPLCFIDCSYQEYFCTEHSCTLGTVQLFGFIGIKVL